MKRLSSLVIYDLLQMTVIAFTVLFTIGLAIDLFENSGNFMYQKLGAVQILKYAALRMPFIISQFSTFCLVLSGMITLNLMSHRGETVALLASGVRHSRVFIMMAMVMAGFCTLSGINDMTVYPRSYMKSTAMIYPESFTSIDKLNDVTLKGDGTIAYIGTVNPVDKILSNVYVITLDRFNQMDSVQYAPLVRFGRDAWNVENGRMVEVRTGIQKKISTITLPDVANIRNLGAVSYEMDWLNIWDILRIIDSGENTGMDVTAYRFLVAKKILKAVVPLLLFFAVFPYGFQVGRNKKNIEIVFISIVSMLVYMVAEAFVFRVFRAVSPNPVYPALLLVSTLVFCGMATWKGVFSPSKR